jgi:transposase
MHQVGCDVFELHNPVMYTHPTVFIKKQMEIGMRTPDHQQHEMFFYVSAESRVPKNHQLRAVKAMVEECLKALDHTFSKMYASSGRPSIPPERLLKALLLQLLYSIRSERSLIEHIDYNILFRWFIGLQLDKPVWNHSTFSTNRDRLIDSEVASPS